MVIVAAGVAAIAVTLLLMIGVLLVARQTRYREAEAVSLDLTDELREVLLANLSAEELMAWSRRVRADRERRAELALRTQGPFDGGI